MKLPNIALLVLSTFLFLLFISPAALAQGKLFTVDDIGDSNDVAVGDRICADSNGKCTLREAIQEANSDVYMDGINFALPLPSTVDLTLGELVITSSVYIAGPGARNLTVQRSFAAGTPQFRIFRVQYPGNPIPTTIRGLTIKNGVGTGDGGAIYSENQSTLQIFDVTITGNTAGGSAGAIFSAGTLTLTRSLISLNTANGLFAGGVVNIGHFTNSIISDSTITNNSGGQGGAIYNTGTLFLINDTITHNSARDAASSVINTTLGTMNVMNTIIGMDNSPAVSSLSGIFVSLGNNIITDARNSTGFTNGINNDQVSDNNAIDPLLGDPANNGGQTDTRALLNGSPAIDHGNSCVSNGNCAQPVPQSFRLTTDQRSRYFRLVGANVDIGAFELQSQPSSGGSLGFGALTFNNRAGGALVTLTNARTNEKQVNVTNPFGNFVFNGLALGDVYFLEMKPKRQNQRAGLTVFDFDTLPMLVPALSDPGQWQIKVFPVKKDPSR